MTTVGYEQVLFPSDIFTTTAVIVRKEQLSRLLFKFPTKDVAV